MTPMELSHYLEHFLAVSRYKDYAPNGLQVEGKQHIDCIVTGVTASQQLIDAAVELNADAILVHHGFFWKGESPVITGMKYRRLKALFSHDINLFGYHLPLDAHPKLGNNAMLGELLEISQPEPLEGVEQDLIWGGQLDIPISAANFAHLIEKKLGRKPLHLGNGDELIQRIGWCSGGAQDYIDIAAQYQFDAFISGEVSERTFHSAIELPIHYFAAGHHATERLGIKALGEHLSEKFELTHHFVDIDNPV